VIMPSRIHFGPTGDDLDRSGDKQRGHNDHGEYVTHGKEPGSVRMEENMKWFNTKPRKKTYYCLGWIARGRDEGVFRDVDLPDGSMMRLMDRGVHQAALESAGEKLVELSRRSGRNAL
jgi:hypothetical protein